jgi:putative ABC transport system permease protein
MTLWLETFAYAAPIGWLVFVAAAVASLGVAWLTVAYQSIRAAMADPVTALHHE